MQKAGQPGDRKPHDVVVTALDLFAEQGRGPLDAVAAGLVVGLVGGDVGLDLLVGEGVKAHPGGGSRRRATRTRRCGRSGPTRRGP